MKIMAWYVSSRKSFGIDRNYVVLRVLDDHVGSFKGKVCVFGSEFPQMIIFSAGDGCLLFYRVPQSNMT